MKVKSPVPAACGGGGVPGWWRGSQGHAKGRPNQPSLAVPMKHILESASARTCEGALTPGAMAPHYGPLAETIPPFLPSRVTSHGETKPTSPLRHVCIIGPEGSQVPALYLQSVSLPLTSSREKGRSAPGMCTTTQQVCHRFGQQSEPSPLRSPSKCWLFLPLRGRGEE